MASMPHPQQSACMTERLFRGNRMQAHVQQDLHFDFESNNFRMHKLTACVARMSSG